MGESIEPEAISKILAALSFNEQYSARNQAQLLWSFMVFMARKVPMNNQFKILMTGWYQALSQQPIDNQLARILARILAMAGVWLGLEANVNPEYVTRTSQLQDVFKSMLINEYTYIKVEEERSYRHLPPVDFYLPEHRLAIEVQGPNHFTNQTSLSRTGRTILKVETYKKLDIHVIEVPYKDIHSQNLQRHWNMLSQLLRSEAQQPPASDPDDTSPEDDDGSSND